VDEEEDMRTKRQLLFISAATVILTLSVACAGWALAAEKAPIKIGLPFSLTGSMAKLGSSQLNAVKQLFEEKGMAVAGRKIQLITEDDEAKPDVGLTKTKRLVQFEKVNLIVGYLHTGVGYAVRDFLHESGMPTVAAFGGARHTRDMFSPYIFRVNPSMFQQTYEPSKWVFKRGYKKIIWVGSDFAAPHEGHQAFKKGFEEAGGKIVQEFWPTTGTTDFGPYLTAVKPDQAGAMVVAVWGADPVRFVNQWVEYGLKPRIPIIGVSTFTDEGVTLPGMGVNADGVLSWYVSCPQTNVPENKKFVEGYKKRYKELPGHFAYLSYYSAQAAYEAMNRVKGNMEDKEKFLDALRKIRFTTPMGYKAYFDEKQGMVLDFIFLEARKADGECHLFEIDRIKEVKDPYQVFP
jgi:branched-chain amino acid transport system substrate-binding protein